MTVQLALPSLRYLHTESFSTLLTGHRRSEPGLLSPSGLFLKLRASSGSALNIASLAVGPPTRWIISCMSMQYSTAKILTILPSDIPRDGSKLTYLTSSCSQPATGASCPSTGFSELSLQTLAPLPALAVCSELLKLPDRLFRMLSIPRLDQMRESRFMLTLVYWCLLFRAWCF